MKKSEPELERLLEGIVRLHANVIGLSFGLLLSLVVFVTTNWLVIKGGKPVGPHLALLSQFFIGYRVSFFGSLIGAAYGFAIGTLAGALLGWVYNAIVIRRNRGKGANW